MKKIILNINDDVFTDLVNAIFIRKLSSSYGGIIDNAINKILESIKDNKKETILEYKNKQDNK